MSPRPVGEKELSELDLYMLSQLLFSTGARDNPKWKGSFKEWYQENYILMPKSN